MIQLTPKGQKLLDKLDPAYGKEVHKAMSVLTKTDLKHLVAACEKLRGNL
ncbi:MAG: hypothetical protein ACYSOZ_08405 [Planctomycetota bacterium]|jgi:DNA-binding MarR family transcriptional regulator